VQRFEEDLKVAQLTIEKLKVEVAYLRRMKYGRSSERPAHEQLELVGGQGAPTVEGQEAAIDTSNVASLDEHRKKRPFRPRPDLRDLPDHLPRRTSCICRRTTRPAAAARHAG
jgi:transposase